MSRRSFLQAAGAAAAALSLAPDPLFRQARAAAAEPQQDTFYSYCDNCNGVPFCGLKMHTLDGVITEIEPWGEGFPASPPCSKGYSTFQRQYNPNRLLYPMMRTAPKGAADPKFMRITWDEAYRRIAQALKSNKEKYGADKAVFYVGDPKEPRAAVRLLSSVYGSINFGTESSVNCSSAQTMANVCCFGTQVLSVGLPAPGTKCCLIWGTNFPYSNAPSTKAVLRFKEQGCKFIVVDPRATPTAALFADVHLRPRTAVTAALAAGMANVIISENLHDKEFCEKWIHGWDEYVAYVKQFTPERTQEITWVPKEDMIAAARTFATVKPSMILNSTMSTIHDRNAVNNHRGMVMLYAITGQRKPFPGKKPPSPFPPGFVFWPFTDDVFTRYDLVKDKFNQRLDLPYHPAWTQYTKQVMMNRFPEWVNEGKCRVFLAWGFNVMIWSQTKEYVAALRKLDFSMATDYFYRPHTHDELDIILPASTNLERYAPFAIFGRKCYGRKPVPALGQAREDWRIAMEIGKAIGEGDKCYQGDPVAACNGILGWWKKSYKDLTDNLTKGVVIETPYPPLPEGEGYPTPSGKVEARSSLLEKYGYPPLPEYKEPYQPTKEYPLLIISGTRRAHITHSKCREHTPWLLELESRPYCDINPEDAKERGLSTGDPVVITSQWGRIDAFAQVTKLLPKGIVGMMHGWVQANVNELMPREYDPISGYPSLKEIAVQVVKKTA
jgi:anaerobic selenocysteine-containing dehydrogenase